MPEKQFNHTRKKRRNPTKKWSIKGSITRTTMHNGLFSALSTIPQKDRKRMYQIHLNSTTVDHNCTLDMKPMTKKKKKIKMWFFCQLDVLQCVYANRSLGFWYIARCSRFSRMMLQRHTAIPHMPERKVIK